MNENEREFALDVICRGNYLQKCRKEVRQIETIVIVLNNIAANEWILSSEFNVRCCYETDEEWRKFEPDIKRRRNNLETKIKSTLGLENFTGNFTIEQNQSDIFTVICESKL